jgi:hydrogen peroxide-dependent heme synthase
MEPVEASTGWGVLHLFYDVDTRRAEDEPGGAKRVVDAIAAFTEDPLHQVLTCVVLGHKAELGVMAVGPDLARLQVLQHDLRSAPLHPTYSYVSLTEASEYAMTEDDERSRLAADEGVTDPAEVEARLVVWRDRIVHYREQRLHPQLPHRSTLCFYPMSKRRSGVAADGENWYALSFEARKALMAGHARVGRTYAGRVVQLITGSTGIDDWEWGVTLFADDLAALKEIVYEMRFDPVSAQYGEFGPFLTGLVLEPAEALRRVGLSE